MSSECLSCLGLAGTPRISPGPPIYIGSCWQVEHAYPCRVVGWLVIAVHDTLGTAKEYAACYAEAKGFEHIHFHVVPRAHDMPEELLGAGSFELLRVPGSEAADPVAVKAFCELLQKAFPAAP